MEYPFSLFLIIFSFRRFKPWENFILGSKPLIAISFALILKNQFKLGENTVCDLNKYTSSINVY